MFSLYLLLINSVIQGDEYFYKLAAYINKQNKGDNMRVMFKKTSMASSLNKSTILDNINLYNHSGSTDYHEQLFDLCF